MSHVSRAAARLAVVLVLCLVSTVVFTTPALADEPGTQTITVTRGGQTFLSNALETEVAPDGRLMRAGSFIVKFRATAGLFERDIANRLAGALRADRMIAADTLRVQVARGRTFAALQAYLGHFAVDRVEPDYIAHAIDTPNDSNFSQQWGMTKVGATAAWDVSKGGGVRIAILDCGIYHPGSSTYVAPDGQVGHPDLRSGKVTGDRNFTTASTADDFCNHGTHVAGIAAANTNNGIGVAGLGRDASLVNVKVLGDNGSGSFSWIENGILYAAGCDTNPCGPRRAEIINMSLGATGSCTASMQSAINKAWGNGLVIVAAAGNSGASGAITPANCQNVVGVSASDQNDAKASFSNFGSGVDVAAPGVSILSSDYVGGYSSFNGTSMASPHVAGLAALVWNGQSGSNTAVVDRINCTANENALAGSANGRIDAAAAVSAASCGAPPPAPTLSIGDRSANEGNSGTTFTFTVTRSGDTSGASSVNWATANGSATAGSDYVAGSGTVSFGADVISQTIDVSVNGDTTSEANETFTVNLSSASGATISDGQGVGTIVNDDAAPLPTLSIKDNSRNERDSSTRNLTFTITLSASSSQSVSVAYATSNVSATGGSSCSNPTDYLSRSGTVTFSPGSTSRSVSVPICGDRRIEGDETFTVNLGSPANATIADGTGIGTILDDD